MARWEWLVASAAGFLIAGGAAGYHLGYRMGTAHSWLGAISVSRVVADRAEFLYSEGELDAARDGLESYLNFLDQVEQRGGGKALDLFWLDDRGLAFDRMLTLARLAMIEERNERPAGARAEELWRRAVLEASKVGLQDTSVPAIRALADRAGKRAP